MRCSMTSSSGLQTRRCTGAFSTSGSLSLTPVTAGFRRAGRRPVVVKALLELQQSAAAATSSLLDVAQHHATLLHTLAEDPVAQAVSSVASSAGDAVAAAGAATAAAGATAADAGGGDFLTNIFETALKALDSGLEKVGVPYSYGFAIILLTILVKAATFPLSKTQVESTISLQALQPRVKELQAKYANNPEDLQIETARLYKEAGVNPLAGCLPTLATIPVFIGLYRALSKAADDGLLTSGFFWIPSLGGPATLADRTAGGGLQWLFPFVDGHPPIGWGQAAAYLVMPVLLVASQFISQKIISPPTDKNADQSTKTTQQILQFLPLMIGWFSLNVPSGLTLYWFVNNILSTAQQLYLKSTTKPKIPALAGSGGLASNAILDVTASSVVLKPKEDRVKKTSGKESGSRKKRSDGSDADGDDIVVSSSSSSNGSSSSGGGKGEKFRALKAREAAARAKAAAGATATVGSGGGSSNSSNGNGTGGSA